MVSTESCIVKCVLNSFPKTSCLKRTGSTDYYTHKSKNIKKHLNPKSTSCFKRINGTWSTTVLLKKINIFYACETAHSSVDEIFSK